jgi:hypothetical protein
MEKTVIEHPRMGPLLRTVEVAREVAQVFTRVTAKTAILINSGQS